MKIDEQLKQFATERQSEYIDAVNKYGSFQNAADRLKVCKGSVQNGIDQVRRKAAVRGYAPDADMTRITPAPYVVRGTSNLYDGDGVLKASWVKTRLDDDQFQQMLLDAIEGFKDDIPRVSMLAPPPLGNSNILNCYVITDYHMGMLSWKPETGDDWDLKLAEELIVKWFAQAIVQSPDADTAVFAQMSDFLHFDGMDAVTPASKHLLDVDTRFAKVVRSAIRVLRTVIDMLLQKHQKVHIIMADANHDPVSQIWLREWFSVLYENEPRITVDKSPSPYNVYEFGSTALFFHHGHKRRVTNVSEVFAAQFREIYGRTKHAFAHTGHLHHLDVKENNLMIVEQHRTLAPADAYAARGGWITGRDAKVITYHKEFGEVSRLTINSDMLK
jgi:hypothetical protein